MAYAVGKYSKAQCDRCGFVYKYTQLKTEWNNLKVCFDCYEPKHPQLEPRARTSDPQGLQNARPARTENPSLRLLELNPFETRTSGSSDINVREPGHGRTAGDTVRFYGPATTGTGTSPPTNTTTLVRSYGVPLSFDGVTGANIGRAAGYTITLGKKDSSGNIVSDTTTDFYHFTVATNTATTGGIQGGGDLISSGPVTLSS